MNESLTSSMAHASFFFFLISESYPRDVSLLVLHGHNHSSGPPLTSRFLQLGALLPSSQCLSHQITLHSSYDPCQFNLPDTPYSLLPYSSDENPPTKKPYFPSKGQSVQLFPGSPAFPARTHDRHTHLPAALARRVLCYHQSLFLPCRPYPARLFWSSCPTHISIYRPSRT